MPSLPSHATLRSQGISAALTLSQWHDRSTGLYFVAGSPEKAGDTPLWWNSASALTAMIDHASLRDSADIAADIAAEVAHTYASAQRASISGNAPHTNFINDFYDDEGWWALAWIRAFDATGNSAEYLSMAETIFSDMTGGWDAATCGGGIWWSKARTYKNAIANELFLAVAAALALRTSDPSYQDWASQAWAWFRDSGMINAEGLVNDGLKPAPGCANNGQPTWTYNQGVILGALCDAYLALGDPSCLDAAGTIADAATGILVDASGILTEPIAWKATPGSLDAPQFKGIFMRNLARLFEETANPAHGHFILRNAAALWQYDCDIVPGGSPEGETCAFFGMNWSGPVDSHDFVRQSSALDALNAAARVRRSQENAEA